LFFFSSRRRHTRCLSDWSSDVCSSDLDLIAQRQALRGRVHRLRTEKVSGVQRDGRTELEVLLDFVQPGDTLVVTREAGSGAKSRSEERRVGKECREGWGGGEERRESDA